MSGKTGYECGTCGTKNIWVGRGGPQCVLCEQVRVLEEEIRKLKITRAANQVIVDRLSAKITAQEDKILAVMVDLGAVASSQGA